jgi:hypothetical protein
MPTSKLNRQRSLNSLRTLPPHPPLAYTDNPMSEAYGSAYKSPTVLTLAFESSSAFAACKILAYLTHTHISISPKE